MSGGGSEQSDKGADWSSPLNLAHVSDSGPSVQRGVATDGPPLRLCVSATVVKGFGRGSKLLGIPTANMNMGEIGEAVRDTRTGIYFGYTMLKEVVYPAVVSVGWNPYFDNEEKTVEAHLLHTFEEDFYGEKLYLLLCGFIRNELNFESLDDLIVAIKGDIDYAKSKFRESEIESLATEHPFWIKVAGGNLTVAAVGSDPGSGAGGVVVSASTALNMDESESLEPKSDRHEAYEPELDKPKAVEPEAIETETVKTDR